MKLSIKPRGPGRWKVYRNVGIVGNESAGVIIRDGRDGPQAVFYDEKKQSHLLGSNPRQWENQITTILENQP